MVVLAPVMSPDSKYTAQSEMGVSWIGSLTCLLGCRLAS